MKKSLLALAILGAIGGTASAQTAVTVYGLVDAGLVQERGAAAGNVTKLSSGVQSGSRLGFRGTEDLGSGITAKFALEAGIGIDTGASNQGGLAWGRQAWVGIGSDAGSFTFGRQYSPLYTAELDVDPFKAGMAGDAQNILNPTPLTTSITRINNAIKYVSPTIASGLIGELDYGFGEVAGNNTAGRTYGGALGYTYGPGLVKLAYNALYDATGNDRQRNTLLLGVWDFGVATANLGFTVNKGFTTIDSRDILIGTTVPFGPHTLLASYIRKDDRSAFDRDARQWALGYTYAFSKRTNFYTAYGRIINDNGGTLTVNTAIDTGSGDSAFNLGIRHTF